MSGQVPISDNFWPLLDAACDDTLSETQSQQLVALLDSDTAACRVLIDHVQLQTDIRLLCQAERACDRGIARIQAAFPQTLPPNSPPPLITFLGSGLDGTVGDFPGSLAFAYLVAAVLVGLGMMIGSLVPVSRPEQVAQNSTPTAQSVVEPKMEIVGRITGMVDCQWADPANEAINGSVCHWACKCAWLQA